jgi:hypothetical protein
MWALEMYERKWDEIPNKRGKPCTMHGDPCLVEGELDPP